MFGVLRNRASTKILECILCSYVLFLWGQRAGEYLPLWELLDGLPRWPLRLAHPPAMGGRPVDSALACWGSGPVRRSVCLRCVWCCFDMCHPADWSRWALFHVCWTLVFVCVYEGFPGLSGKESACNAGATGFIPGSGRSPGGQHGNPLQYSCLENLMDRGAWRATVHRVTRVGHEWSDLASTQHVRKHPHPVVHPWVGHSFTR